MSKKVILDVESAIKYYNEANGAKMTKTELAKTIGVKKSGLSRHQHHDVPKALHIALNVSIVTGYSLDKLVKKEE